MFTLFRTTAVQEIIKRELLPFLAAFIIAEQFYKFRSFTLECIAFLITWVCLSYLQSLLVGGGKRDG